MSKKNKTSMFYKIREDRVFFRGSDSDPFFSWRSDPNPDPIFFDGSG